MTRTVFRVTLLDAVRMLGGPTVIALGCGPHFSTSEIQRGISNMHPWLEERLLELFDDEDSILLAETRESFISRLSRFNELAVKRNESEENTLTQEELSEAAQILIGLHQDYYARIHDYRELTDTICGNPVE